MLLKNKTAISSVGPCRSNYRHGGKSHLRYEYRLVSFPIGLAQLLP
jgi:hypothetical protein